MLVDEKANKNKTTEPVYMKGPNPTEPVTISVLLHLPNRSHKLNNRNLFSIIAPAK
jgi:hypothetical protein